jgi:energy-converting hydrogenase Eha subunit E
LQLGCNDIIGPVKPKVSVANAHIPAVPIAIVYLNQDVALAQREQAFY